jgi:DnaJ-class molecular chaperone
MSRNNFGWDLPPGCSHRDIDEAFGDPETIECPTCEGQGEVRADQFAELTWWATIKNYFRLIWMTCPECKGEQAVIKTEEKYDGPECEEDI